MTFAWKFPFSISSSKLSIKTEIGRSIFEICWLLLTAFLFYSSPFFIRSSLSLLFPMKTYSERWYNSSVDSKRAENVYEVFFSSFSLQSAANGKEQRRRRREEGKTLRRYWKLLEYESERVSEWETQHKEENNIKASRGKWTVR